MAETPGITFGIDGIEAIGAAIAQVLRAGDVIGLSGDLGAGKTSLARAILTARGLTGEAPSPTFAIVQPYAPPETDMPILHCDLYRLTSPGELIELGLDDARSDHALLIEWPERFGSAEPRDMLVLRLDFAGLDARRLTAEVPPAWEDRWPLR